MIVQLVSFGKVYWFPISAETYQQKSGTLLLNINLAELNELLNHTGKLNRIHKVARPQAAFILKTSAIIFGKVDCRSYDYPLQSYTKCGTICFAIFHEPRFNLDRSLLSSPPNCQSKSNFLWYDSLHFKTFFAGK